LSGEGKILSIPWDGGQKSSAVEWAAKTLAGIKEKGKLPRQDFQLKRTPENLREVTKST